MHQVVEGNSDFDAVFLHRQTELADPIEGLHHDDLFDVLDRHLHRLAGLGIEIGLAGLGVDREVDAELVQGPDAHPLDRLLGVHGREGRVFSQVPQALVVSEHHVEQSPLMGGQLAQVVNPFVDEGHAFDRVDWPWGRRGDYRPWRRNPFLASILGSWLDLIGLPLPDSHLGDQALGRGRRQLVDSRPGSLGFELLGFRCGHSRTWGFFGGRLDPNFIHPLLQST